MKNFTFYSPTLFAFGDGQEEHTGELVRRFGGTRVLLVYGGGSVKQNGAFDAVADGQYNLDPSSSCVNAVKDAMNGWDPTAGCLYYYNPKTATNAWIWTRTVQLTIGNHAFAHKLLLTILPE